MWIIFTRWINWKSFWFISSATPLRAARNMLHCCTLLTDRLHLHHASAFLLLGHNGALFIILECTFLPVHSLPTTTPVKLGYRNLARFMHVLVTPSEFTHNESVLHLTVIYFACHNSQFYSATNQRRLRSSRNLHCGRMGSSVCARCQSKQNCTTREQTGAPRNMSQVNKVMSMQPAQRICCACCFPSTFTQNVIVKRLQKITTHTFN